MTKRGLRRMPDVRRMTEAVAAPGIDPRIWITLARVDDVGFDSDHGIFADVTFLPGGESETALIGADYVGDGFGEWDPLTKGDVVIVCNPMGDPSQGPVILRRLWGKKQKPPSEFGDGEDGSQDRIVKTKSGQKYRVITDKAVIGDADAKPLAHSDPIDAILQDLNQLLLQLTSYVQGIQSIVDPAPPNTLTNNVVTAIQKLQQTMQLQQPNIPTKKLDGT